MEEVESDLDKALRSLKNQGVSVKTGGVAADGFIFEVDGFLLTGDQLLALHKQNKLHRQGIREFDLKEREIVEKDIELARKQIRPEELKSWTAKEVCDYINGEFERNHSVGQIRGVLNRLGIEYKRV